MYAYVIFVVLAISTLDAKDDQQHGRMRGEMVGFSCGRPSIYLNEQGEWIRDQSADCLKEPADILDFCRKVYSNSEVWNVVESGKNYVIKEWCSFGKSKCRDEIVIRPYRCLVGSFESEALQVPESCRFDLVHDSTDCKSYSAWNASTAELCRHKKMLLHSFSILQPCDVDGFAGAEFVCCPLAKKPDDKKPETQTYSRVSKDKQTAPKQVVASVNDQTGSHVIAADDDAYKTYLRQSHDPNLSEHEYFLKAKAELDRQHHQRVDKIMREWASARKQVQEIKKGDSKGGEKFNREMTARFQKAYESLEREDAERKKQLLELHDQRVNIDTNQKKRIAMDAYMTALKSDEPQSTTILKALMKYIKVEQKDRLHSISHYKHVQHSDPVEAESMRSQVADRLRSIDERVTQSINMLAQVPKFEKKIRDHIEKFLSQYDSFDESLSVIMTKIDESNDASEDLHKHIRHTTTTPTTSTTVATTTTTTAPPTTTTSYADADSEDLDDYDYEDELDDDDDEDDDDEDDEDDLEFKHTKKNTAKNFYTQKNFRNLKSSDIENKNKLNNNKKLGKNDDKSKTKKTPSPKLDDEIYDEDEEDIEDYEIEKINRKNFEKIEPRFIKDVQNVDKSSSTDLSKDVSKDQNKDQSKDQSKDLSRDHSKDTDHDFTKESSKDLSKETNSDKSIKIEDDEVDEDVYNDEDEVEFKLKLAQKDDKSSSRVQPGSPITTKKYKAIWSSLRAGSVTKATTVKQRSAVDIIVKNEEAGGHQHIIANNAKNDMSMDQIYYKKSAVKSAGPSSRMVAPIAIMIAVAAIFVGAVVGVIVLRTRQADEPNHNVMTVEDRQQCANVKMEARKMNGYENPTYHFYNKLAATIKNIDDEADEETDDAHKIQDA